MKLWIQIFSLDISLMNKPTVLNVCSSPVCCEVLEGALSKVLLAVHKKEQIKYSSCPPQFKYLNFSGSFGACGAGSRTDHWSADANDRGRRILVIGAAGTDVVSSLH